MGDEKRIWEFKQSANEETLELYIYDYIQGDHFDWYSWSMVQSETSANHFKQELAKYPNIKQINIYVNSYGGSVYEAMSIRNQLKRHQAQITAYVDGFACSAASFILTGCDEVKMYSNTMQMIHNMYNCVCGNAGQLRKAADDLDVMMDGNRQAYLEKSNGKITAEKLTELLEAESWLTAKQCLEYGLCDEIINEQADLTKADQMMQKINLSLEQQVNYNKGLAAMLKQTLEGLNQKEPPKEPQKDPNPEPQQNSFKLFAAFNANKQN